MKKGIYKHYKGKMYQVIGLARHSETEEEYVVYRALYGDFGLWIRPKGMFMENVYEDGQERPRFEYQSSRLTLKVRQRRLPPPANMGNS